jgi:hypothetical protein
MLTPWPIALIKVPSMPVAWKVPSHCHLISQKIMWSFYVFILHTAEDAKVSEATTSVQLLPLSSLSIISSF